MPEKTGVAPRIALVVRPGEASGYPVAALLAECVEHGWDAHLLCDSPQPLERAVIESLRDDTLCTRVHPPVAGYGRRSPRRDPAFGLVRGLRRRPAATLRALRPGAGPPQRSLRALVVGLAPRLVHLPSGAVAEDWIGVATAVGARTLVSVQSDEVNATAFDFPERYRGLWTGGAALHLESDALASLVRQHGAAANTVSVISPAADPLLLSHKPAPARPPLRILSVGPLSWTQGYEHALCAVKLLVGRGIQCEYRIVGRGEHLDSFTFARHQCGLDGCVEFVQPASADELREHLRWASVFVNVAVVATSPKTILDAQAAGVPVVSSELPAAAADTVLSVPARQPEALCETLAMLEQDKVLRARVVDAGRRRALEASSPTAQAARFLELYRDLLADA